MRLGNRKANPSKSPSSLPLYPAGVNGEYRVAHMEPPQSGQRPESRQLQTLALELRHSSEREAGPRPNLRDFSAIPFQDFIFTFVGSGVVSQQGDSAALRIQCRRAR